MAPPSVKKPKNSASLATSSGIDRTSSSRYSTPSTADAVPPGSSNTSPRTNPVTNHCLYSVSKSRVSNRKFRSAVVAKSPRPAYRDGANIFTGTQDLPLAVNPSGTPSPVVSTPQTTLPVVGSTADVSKDSFNQSMRTPGRCAVPKLLHPTSATSKFQSRRDPLSSAGRLPRMPITPRVCDNSTSLVLRSPRTTTTDCTGKAPTGPELPSHKADGGTPTSSMVASMMVCWV